MNKFAIPVVLCVFSLLLVRPAMLPAQMESESRHVFRGGESGSPPPPNIRDEVRDEPRATPSPRRESAASTLPPRPLRIYVEQDALTREQSRMLHSALGTSPLLQQSASQDGKDGADIRLHALPPEKHASSPQARIRLEGAPGALFGGKQDFLLPRDAALLRTTLEGHMRLRAVASAKGSMPWPDIAVSVQAYSPADKAGPGTIRHEKKNWRPTHGFTLARDAIEPIARPALLTFSFSNRSNAAYCIYVLNYNDGGQILPVFPPLGAANMPNRVAAGKELAPTKLWLELTAPVEYVRVIVSQKPLDIPALAQESFASGRLRPGAGRGKPANAQEWSSVTVKLTAK